MFAPKSFIYRVAAAKTLGFLVGLAVFVSMPLLVEEASMSLRIGLMFWYTTVGAFVGLMGIWSKHPILEGFGLPWWLRGALIGGWMNFVLYLIAAQQISAIVIAMFGEYSAWLSPYLMVLEGILVGVFIDYVVTHQFGEGWMDKHR